MKGTDRSQAAGARILVFGEALFDVFPDGAQVLGGAPFNVAWHLQGLGMNPLFVSRIGDDERGRRVLAAMRGWGMDVAGVQRDESRPTGGVRILMDGAQHRFDILPGQAYDRIDADAALAAARASRIDVIYHGTLALRDAASRDALHALRDGLDARACIDLNLRAPWWNEAGVEAALRGASWVKLNDAELRTVAGEPVAARGGGGNLATQLQWARTLRERCGAESVLVTRGELGAFICARNSHVEAAAEPVERPVDTVGAGDGFAAVALTGLTRGWAPETTLARALEFAAWICGLRGATAPDAPRYARFRAAWGLDDVRA